VRTPKKRIFLIFGKNSEKERIPDFRRHHQKKEYFRFPATSSEKRIFPGGGVLTATLY
jgi:hypothetical protein